MPCCVFIPRILEYNLDASAETNGAQLALNVFKQTSNSTLLSIKELSNNMDKYCLGLNPFFCLTKVSEMP
jgi:hypothetical protein